MQIRASVKNQNQNGKGTVRSVSSRSTLFAKVFVLVYRVERVKSRPTFYVIFNLDFVSHYENTPIQIY